jgi:hypothetical protein
VLPEEFRTASKRAKAVFETTDPVSLVNVAGT